MFGLAERRRGRTGRRSWIGAVGRTCESHWLGEGGSWTARTGETGQVEEGRMRDWERKREVEGSSVGLERVSGGFTGDLCVWIKSTYAAGKYECLEVLGIL